MVFLCEIDSIKAIGKRRYFVPFIFKEEDLGMQAFYFIIDPQYFC
jgi:hypothetical protein